MNDAPDEYTFMDPSQYSDLHGDGGPVVSYDGFTGKTFRYRRADLPATRAQIMASPEVRALVDAAASAIVVMQEAKGVIVAKREWSLVDGTVKDLRAALAAFKAMEAGE